MRIDNSADTPFWTGQAMAGHILGVGELIRLYKKG